METGTHPHLLIIEDDVLLNDMTKRLLTQHGYCVTSAYSGSEALLLIEKGTFDLILLDLMLPGIPGETVLEKMKSTMDIPIIGVSAKTDIDSKVNLIRNGADDYITKPFNILEVKARIKAIMRRTAASQPKKEDSKVIEAGDLKLDCESRRLFILGKEVNLTAKEFDLLELLVNNPNKVYGRENLLNLVWGYEYPGDVRTVDVHVRRLREKIESNPSEPKYVHTKWGVGYYYSQN